MSFDALIGKLGELRKAQSPDDASKDAKVAAAAAEGAAASNAASEGDDKKGEGEAAAAANAGDGAAAKAAACEGGEKPMAKSITLILENGDEMEAFDGAELIKALTARIDDNEAKTQAVLEQAVELIGAQATTLGEQSATIADLQKSLADQTKIAGEADALIKSMRTDLDTLRAEPVGRKSVQNPAQVSAEDPLAKSLKSGEGDGLTPQAFLAKSLILQKQGHLSLQEVVTAEAAIGSGVAVPEHIVTKVFSH